MLCIYLYDYTTLYSLYTTHILYVYHRYQPVSVQWRPGFSFLRQGTIGSYTTLFTTDDLIEYGQNYDPSVVDEFMRCILEYDDNNNNNNNNDSNNTDDVSEREVGI